MEDKKILLDNIDKIHTTEMGIDRIKRNLKIDTADVVEYCKIRCQIKIAIYTNRVKIGIAKLKTSKLLSIHIVIQLSQHILLSKIGLWSEIMDYIIREMRSEEYCLLSDFLYEAIYIPEGIEPPPKSVIECPELQEYIVEFGNRKHDKALVAEMQGNVIGAIWVRIMNDYGHIDNDTPSLAMSVYKKYRGLGIGTSLLKQLLQVERLAGYSKISLSVQKSNYAVKMYEKVGFTVADENNEEYIMIVNL